MGKLLSDSKLRMRLSYLDVCIEFKLLTLSWVFGKTLVFKSGGVKMRGTCNQGESKSRTLSSLFVLEGKLQGVTRTLFVKDKGILQANTGLTVTSVSWKALKQIGHWANF